MEQSGSKYILLTGAAGFIGSCMAAFLNEQGYSNLILVDDFGREDKRKNWEGKQYAHVVERYNLEDWLQMHEPEIDLVIHLGARTDTTEFDYAIHEELNVVYSKMLWEYCTNKQVPFIYASSAATYGAGELGYNDDHELPFKLHPLNPYGISKNEFDKWAIAQGDASLRTTDGSQRSTVNGQPPFWAGLKFFNVYGPNEYHKGRMASVIWHAFNQIKENGFVKLFKSHRPDFKDGQQLRDFIYVKDVVKVIGWMMEKTFDDRRQTTELLQSSVVPNLSSGLYNLGTGQARSFYDLASNTFTAQGRQPNIQFIDMPEDIRDKYQYFTEANMQKLHHAEYNEPFYSLEEGIADYVQQYLLRGKYM